MVYEYAYTHGQTMNHMLHSVVTITMIITVVISRSVRRRGPAPALQHQSSVDGPHRAIDSSAYGAAIDTKPHSKADSHPNSNPNTVHFDTRIHACRHVYGCHPPLQAASPC